MKLTRVSMIYLATYLVSSGLPLLLAPDFAFKLLQSNSNGAYGDIIPRLAGAVILALGGIVVQIIRLDLHVLHSTTLALRVMLLSTIVFLYTRSGDPFFAIVAGIVALGMTLTATGLVLERRATGSAPAQ
jgi:hypothetical protein